ncbi:MAG TPA: endonuclease/exonuclease/phosphatase family protein [Methylomirabilota bacterium]|nr:endonuclease/exonuclease/phosphatase family protein [Methylomirabilota bacterium]
MIDLAEGIAYFSVMRRAFLTVVLVACLGWELTPQTQGEDAARTLRVMTFNLWHGGDAGGQPLSQSAEVIRLARADVIGLQETAGHAPGEGKPRPDNGSRLASLMGFHYLDQGERRGVLSRHPIIGHSPSRLGVEIRLPDGETFWLFNVHLAHAPYQPYQLLGIPYEDGAFLTTAEEAVEAAHAARGGQVGALIEELRGPLKSGSIVFLTGDFNEPSHEDWTVRSAAAGMCLMAVNWPATRAVEEAGFKDSYRVAHPDELRSPGRTWTPITKENDPKDRHDRIDFVFFGGNGVELLASEVVGERADRADIVVVPYPSDHRAVVSAFRLVQE